MIKWLKYICIGLLSIVLSDILLAWWQHNQAIVVLSNQSGQELSHMQVIVSGEKYEIGQLSLGNSKTLRVRPAGEADVSLGFDTPTQKNATWSGGYIESSGGYKIVITIGDGLQVSEHTSLRRGFVVWPLLRKFVRHGRG